MAIHGGQVFDDTGRRKYVSGHEFPLFLAAADQWEPRRRAFCYALAYGGCRVSEAVVMTVHHLDPHRMTITLRTLKRRRLVFRVVPVPELLVAMLLDLPPVTEDGRFWSMCRKTAWQIVKETMCRAGIVGPMASPKGLRHGFGIRGADRNVPPGLLQKWMGHASMKTTAIYTDAVGSEERQFARRMW